MLATLPGEVGDGGGLNRGAGRGRRPDAAGEDAAVGVALLAEEALLAVGASADGVPAPGPGGRDDERGGQVLVAAPVTAVLLPPGGGERLPADRAVHRLGTVW